jgi:hypothetical protein
MKQNRIHKSFRNSMATLSADANVERNPENRNRGNDIRVIQNISVEEWDCPRPEAKKYMPKSIKENIRKNLKKMNSKVGDKSDEVEQSPNVKN